MDVKENVKNTDTWLRGLLILLFGCIFYVAFWIIWLLVIFQFVYKLITGNLNNEVAKVCGNLTDYVLQILRYVTFRSEFRPFPFNPWPGKSDESDTVSPVEESEVQETTPEPSPDDDKDSG
ncbi:MAG TPA: DUF4389 domain-containing protein [Gammaproteobacteria bacterium]|nr:DUF4389 domain-containing protein [Gammaproteobacteria bacterium]